MIHHKISWSFSIVTTNLSSALAVIDIALPCLVLRLVERGGLVLNWHGGASGRLVLAADEVGDLLVLGLLDGGLIVLLALAQNVLLDVVDAVDHAQIS